MPEAHAQPDAAHPRRTLVDAAAALGVAALGYSLASAIRLHRISDAFELRYSDTGLPMLAESDGYFHLWRAKAILAGQTSWTAEPPLSALAALASSLAHVPVELVAFWLPALFAAACGIWFWAFGRLLGAPRLHCALAAFAGAMVPAWFGRCCPGWFDTDPGIAFFWLGGLYATARMSLAPGRPAAPHLLLLAACFVLLAWWWKPGLAMAPFFLMLWGGSFPLADQKPWRTIRLATVLTILAAAAALLLLPSESLPEALARHRDYLLIHAQMVLGRTSDAALLSIDELAPLSPLDLLRELGGNALSGACALAAAGLVFLRAPRPGLFLLPSLAAALLALAAQRFVFFAALPVALGIGLLPWLATQHGSVWPLLRSRLALPLAWCASAAMLASLAHAQTTAELRFSFQTPQDRLALTLGRVAPQNARLWNWWDDGYFLAARSGLTPLFHGGSQTGRMGYIAARPLVADDPLLARRWIRLFALRGEGALAPLRAALGDEDAAWQALEKILASQDMGAALSTLPRLAEGPGWFSPEGRVFLYLPQRFLRLSMWWMGMGGSRSHDVASFKPHIDSFRRTNFRFDPVHNRVELPPEVLAKGYKDFGGVFVTSRSPLAPPFGAEAPGPYVVTSELSPWLYIVDEGAIRSVGFRLLAPGGAALPGFSPVLVNYAFGGLWEVLP